MISNLPFDLILVLLAFGALFCGVPVGVALGGTAVVLAAGASQFGAFDPVLLSAIPARLFGIATGSLLTAVPLFVLMGLVLEKTGLVEDMIKAMTGLTRGGRVGLPVAVVCVGILLAASTGIVGASVVMLGLLTLKPMIDEGVPQSRAAGIVAATGTLGQIVPPSIVLIVLGDQLSNAYRTMQLDAGIFAPDSISVSDLFAAGLVPGLLLGASFIVYLWVAGRGDRSEETPSPASVHAANGQPTLILALAAPIVLMVCVLGSILTGFATPTEAASVGLVAALVLAFLRQGRRLFKSETVPNILVEAAHLTAMIFFIVFAASIFALVFRGFGGDERLTALFSILPGGTYGALLFVMVVIFLLGFFLEFLEICTLVVPLVAPVLLALPMADGSPMNPVWLGILIALNLQTSFLTPPFGVSLFYLRSVAPPSLTDSAVYRGVAPFIALQLAVLGLVFFWPALATALPTWLFGE